MIYNVDFLIAALIFMLVILYHFMQQQAFYMRDNRTFLWLVVLSIMNICFDMFCTVLITLSNPAYLLLSEISLTILYLLQILVPNALLAHVFRQFPPNVGRPKIRFLLCCLVPAVFCILILTNHWHGLFFRLFPDGSYARGKYYILMYCFGGGYLAIAALSCFFHRSNISRFKMYAIWEMVLISGITVVFQSIYHDILLTGFGITLGITVLFFTLNNPFHYTDSLTSAFDIRYFRDRSRSYIEHRRTFHVLLLELTQLKRINHVTGAGFGNNILRATAQFLRDIDKRNLVFRVTGRRFILITHSLVLYEEARTRILQHFSDPITVDGREIQVPVTLCGILNAEELGSSDNLLSYGEYLLSLVPPPRKMPHLIQNSEQTLRGFRYNQIVDQYLPTAVKQDLFNLVYQPVYSTIQKKYTSMEVLSRLSHPSLGPISPDIFIRLAEKNDLIPQIGLLQLKKVCSFLNRNPEIMENMESIKVNLSPVELMRPGHVDLLIDTIRQAGLPTSFFQFEITETVATEYSSSLALIANKFTDADIGLCMDDFGSGYANLNTVFRLPFSTIKLDRSLLMDISHNPKAAALYQGLISSIHAMDVRIIAEGVETAQEIEKVHQCGVDLIQGFYYSKPLPPHDLLELIHRQAEEGNAEPPEEITEIELIPEAFQPTLPEVPKPEAPGSV